MGLKVFNPATEELIEELEEDTLKSIASKIKKAHKAQKDWAVTPVAQRKKAIQKFSDLLLDSKDILAQTLTLEMGKPLSQSLSELQAMPERAKFYIENIDQALSKTTFDLGSSRTQEQISYEPLGVIANISAWNYPYFVSGNVILPALLTGNAVLFKPSEYSSLSGLKMAALLHEAGIPKDVFIPIIGPGQIGGYLLEEAIDGVFFTGSLATGKKIAEAASKKLIKVQLELGGKDPLYICDDVDLEEAAQAVSEGAFYNTGQSCCAVERIYVQKSIYKSFCDRFVNNVKALIVGNPMDKKTYIGPLVRKAQIRVLKNQIDDALAKGAKLRCGGKPLEQKGNFYEPSVLSEANHSMSLMKDESFGPIVGIQSVDTDEQAIELMNDTEFGLTAAVFSKDQKRAIKILEKLNTGSAYWNCSDRVSPRLPWSGRKNSGLGLTSSFEGIRTFLQPKAWHLRRSI